ncbi:MAG: tripartite tricarboxylate transporter substrate binding protein [Betaproteobacteria bacterium]|nr:tripartite tricarboxylate transporter substrate binding protein [Betaproteobacteria bacterium]
MKLAFLPLICVVSALTLAVGPGLASAQQDYPVKPIRMIVGVAPGGATDILARLIGAKLTENLRQQVIVDSRPGANHTIGGQLTQKAPPDGYTVQIIPEGWVINTSMYTKLPFDPVRDFTAIAILALVPNLLVVHPSIPARSVKQFIALARARPGQLNYGTSSVGAPSHMSAELLKVLTRVEYTHVPYKGQSLALVALLGGQIDFAFPSIPSSVGYIRAGRLRALGVTTTQRASALPDVPTIQEAGVPGYEVAGWYGVIGPAGMPQAVVARLNREINAILKVPETRDQLSRQGADPRTGTPEEFAAAMANDTKKWQKVVAAAGIKPQ